MLKEKDKMLKEFSEENMGYQNEIAELKEDLKKKTQELKLLEIELDEKTAKVEELLEAAGHV